MLARSYRAILVLLVQIAFIAGFCKLNFSEFSSLAKNELFVQIAVIRNSVLILQH